FKNPSVVDILNCKLAKFCLTEEAFLHFCNLSATAGAFAHHFVGRAEQILRSLDSLIGSHKFFEHGTNPSHEILRGQLATLDLTQPVLPLSSQKGDCSCSGNTVIRDTASWDGMSCTVFLLFLRSKKPVETSFSRIPARVAGVPRPLRSASSGISSFPAVSIAESSVSSVKCLGGVVLPSLTVAPERGSV